LSVTVGLCRLTAQAAPPTADSSSSAAADAVDPAVTVRAALSLEIDGLDEDRNALLQQVIDQHPDHAPARAHRGEIRVGDRWLPYDRVVHEGERWHQLYMYRKTREERGDSVDDHLFIANGARQRQMWDEERSHLFRILERNWDHEQARQRLGHVHADGMWFTPDQRRQFASYLEAAARDFETWSPRIQSIANRMQSRSGPVRDRATRELAAIRDPAAIAATELHLAGRGDDGIRRYLGWISQMNCWEASVALARQAVFAPSATIRLEAQESLKQRRLDDYVPALIDALIADPKVETRLMTTSRGWLMHVRIMEVETEEARHRTTATMAYMPEFITMSSLQHKIPLTYIGDLVPSVANNYAMRIRARRDLNDRDRQFEADAAEWTARVDQLNSRICRCMQAVTSDEDLDSPEECWDWWTRHNDVFVTGTKPLLSREYSEEWYIDRATNEPRRDPPKHLQLSCFAAGTIVVTEFGPKPIETIELGDRVLAQDVDSGEVDFKPVFKTTVRPPTPLLKLVTAHGELVCTGGHPFWINDHGWLKARELEPGMRLHSVTGSSEVLAVEDAQRTARAYNLVVADFHTYFVGDDRILSHDNTPRNPTNSIVPGLEREFTIAAAP
jgi:hypothetical protein